MVDNARQRLYDFSKQELGEEMNFPPAFVEDYLAMQELIVELAGGVTQAPILGTGSPEGVVTARPGRFYIDYIPPDLPSYPSAVMADSPIGYWRAEETTFQVGDTLADEVANRDLTVNNAAGSSIPGFVNNGVSVAGTLLSNANTLSLPATKSIEFGIRRQSGGSTANAYLFSMGNQFDVVLNYGGANNVGVFRNVGNPQILSNLISAEVPQDNNWYHIVVTHDGSTLSIYRNGVLADSAPVVSFAVSSALIGFGASISGANTFSGGLDEMAVYGTALSPERILAHYNSAASSPVAPNDVYIKAEGTGDTGWVKT